jgi:hypothetical protein
MLLNLYSPHFMRKSLRVRGGGVRSVAVRGKVYWWVDYRLLLVDNIMTHHEVTLLHTD